MTASTPLLGRREWRLQQSRRRPRRRHARPARCATSRSRKATRPPATAMPAAISATARLLMHLMGEWDYNCAKDSSASKLGVGDDNLGLHAVPLDRGRQGPGDRTASAAWRATCSPRLPTMKPIKFIEWFNSKDEQSSSRPRASTSRSARVRPTRCPTSSTRRLPELAGNSTWHQLFFDQTLGADVGGQFNDLALELASGDADRCRGRCSGSKKPRRQSANV